jgi:hypothetical protein
MQKAEIAKSEANKRVAAETRDERLPAFGWVTPQIGVFHRAANPEN